MSIATPQTATTIDALGAGYRAINRRLWLLSLPLSVDLLLWLANERYLQPITEQVRNGVGSAARLLANTTAHAPVIENMLVGLLQLILAWFNLLPLLLPPPTPNSAVLEPLTFAGVLLGFNLVLLACSGLFLVLISGAVTGEQLALPALLRRALTITGRVGMYLLVLLGFGMLLGAPLAILSALLIAAVPETSVAILLCWYIIVFWAYVYTSFAPEAMLISRAGPLRSIYLSVQVVRNTPGSVILFLGLNFVIVSGLTIVWRMLATTPTGFLTALIGSAYIGSGLRAARLEFYRLRAAKFGVG